MDQFLRLITLQDANTRIVLIGTMLLGIASAVVGSFAVLRKQSLVGDAVAHAALPGVCAAYFVVGERNFVAFLAGALVFGVLAAAFVTFVKAWTRVKEDAAIGLAIGGFFGLGIVLSRIIQNQPAGNRAGLDSFIFGKAASMVAADARLILAVAAIVLGATLLFYKEFKLLCFDRDFAAGQGWPTVALDLFLMALVCICTVVGLPAVGVVLMVALLIIPAVAARFWTNRLGVMLVLAAIFGGASGLLGTILSATVPTPAGALSRGWPTGPLIVLTAAFIFIVSLLCAPKRGLIADLFRRYALRRRIAVQNLLRDVYETVEPMGDLERGWHPEKLVRPASSHTLGLRRALREGLVAARHSEYTLTPAGRDAAVRVVRAHRLWELYLIEQADIAPDHVDRDADQLEHVLSPAMIAQLEARLAEREQVRPQSPVVDKPVPASPHPIAPPVRSPGGASLLIAFLAVFLGAFTFVPDVRAGGEANRHENTRVVIESGAAPMLASADAWFSLGSYPIRSDDLWTVAIAICCCIACGLVGCFLLLRRMSLLGDAISHAILPGLAAAFFLTGTREPIAMLAGAMVVGVLTALISTGLNRWGRVPEDASMGVVFTTLFALGVILITLVARDVDLDPGCVLYGLIEFAPFDTVRLLGLELPRSFVWLFIVLAINVTLIAVFFKELKIVCFDPYLATTMGISATAVHYGLMTAVAATSVASFEAVGSILVVAMLVAPGATAHLLTDKLGRMLWWSAAIAGLSAVLGYALAVRLNTSVAGMIATTALGLFVLAAIASPRHGVIARWVHRRIVTPIPTTPTR
ncbi:MAG: metal ABC transporter permease [Phycisphaerae bacterium]|nr:metal ABC transporter permease [Phycisphaerae bacterium]